VSVSRRRRARGAAEPIVPLDAGAADEELARVRSLGSTSASFSSLTRRAHSDACCCERWLSPSFLSGSSRHGSSGYSPLQSAPEASRRRKGLATAGLDLTRL